MLSRFNNFEINLNLFYL